MIDPGKDFWPKSIAHLSQTYLNTADDIVVIAEINDSPVNGYKGLLHLNTALIPISDLNDVLNAPGGIGWKVESWGPHPIVDEEGGYNSSFWIDGPKDSDKRYETIINSWLNHNKTVILPDNGLLMCYGLIPRFLKDGTIYWDDPSKPVYDVIRVIPLSEYIPNEHTYASITIHRDYLEDYLSLKGCAAVAVFYEERYSFDDPDFDKVLGNREGAEFKLPGRTLLLTRVDKQTQKPATQFTRIWGCRLILNPTRRPISNEQEPVLLWPDHEKPVALKQAQEVFGLLPQIYVRDEVLKAYEGKDEFTVHPESGNVSYGSRWSTSRSYRLGRHHIVIDLKGLYEGTPPYVIRHFNKFSVPKAEAERDRKVNGDCHIGQRSRDLIYTYLQFTESLTLLADRVGLFLEQKDIGGFSKKEIEYHGWWTMETLKQLGYLVSLEITFPEFLGRCMDLFKLLEHLKPGPLKQILKRLGMPKTEFSSLGTLRLLGTLCQLAKIAKDNGEDLIDDFTSIHADWDERVELEELSPLFALNSLRNIEGHITGQDSQIRLEKALEVLGIDSQKTLNGWGYALDRVYDKLAIALSKIDPSVL